MCRYVVIWNKVFLTTDRENVDRSQISVFNHRTTNLMTSPPWTLLLQFLFTCSHFLGQRFQCQTVVTRSPGESPPGSDAESAAVGWRSLWFVFKAGAGSGWHGNKKTQQVLDFNRNWWVQIKIGKKREKQDKDFLKLVQPPPAAVIDSSADSSQSGGGIFITGLWLCVFTSQTKDLTRFLTESWTGRRL